MADGTLQILGLGTSAVPLEYTASGDQSLDLVAVNADYDGGAAIVDWQPVVEIISTAGHVMARGVGPTITAGDSASVTFAPFLKTASTSTPSGGIVEIDSADGSIIVTNPNGPFTDLSVAELHTGNAIYLAASETIGPGVDKTFSFSYVSGPTLLDVTTPTVPKVKIAGWYAASLFCNSGDALNDGEGVNLTLAFRTATSVGIYAYSDPYFPGTATGLVLSKVGVCYLPVHGQITADFFNQTGGSSFTTVCSLAVQRLG